MSIFKKILWRLALLFRLKDRIYADYFIEEVSHAANSIIDSINLNPKDIKIVKHKNEIEVLEKEISEYK